MSRILTGKSSTWFAAIDGDDIVVRKIIATAFGGGHDDGDDGQTESGILNDGRNPTLMGCALPIRSSEKATAGSPLAFPGPHIPWGTRVRVWPEADGEDTAITVQLIDNGPDQESDPAHALDLTVFAASYFALDIPISRIANDWEATGFSYRILGAAKYAPAVTR
jgi:hypothetical protein